MKATVCIVPNGSFRNTMFFQPAARKDQLKVVILHWYHFLDALEMITLTRGCDPPRDPGLQLGGRSAARESDEAEIYGR
jgi:hypothetical protein